MSLLRGLCMRQGDGSRAREHRGDTGQEGMPLARKLWGHYLNGFTFPEVIRRYALSLERFSLSERLERLRLARRVANVHACQSSKGREEVYELDGRAHDAPGALRRPGHSD